MKSEQGVGRNQRRAYQVNEAAIAYRLSRSTLYKLMATGTLRSVKIGGRRLIRRRSRDLTHFRLR